MNLFKERALIKAVSDKYRRLDAGAFVEDAIRFEDVDNYDDAVKHHE